MTQAIDVLLEATPADISPADVQRAILEVPGVASVHDLHIWTITSGINALSAHVVLATGAKAQVAAASVDQVAAALKEKFGIARATIQVEYSTRRESELNF